jgi:PilZ domain
VYFSSSQSPIDCLVRDISDSGAWLKFLVPQKITEIMELHIPIKGQTFRSKIRWQAGNEIGIAFNTATADAARGRCRTCQPN